jgi:hypothetical protein
MSHLVRVAHPTSASPNHVVDPEPGEVLVLGGSEAMDPLPPKDGGDRPMASRAHAGATSPGPRVFAEP